MMSEYDEHLLELAHNVDRNIESTLTVVRHYLLSDVSSAGWEKVECVLSETGDASPLASLVASSLLITNGICRDIVLRQNGDVLYPADCTCRFFQENPDTGTGFAKDASGALYLTVSVKKTGSDISYVALIDPVRFYRSTVVSELRTLNRIMLYNADADIFIANITNTDEENDVSVNSYSAGTAVARDEGYRVLADNVRKGAIMTESYSLTGADGSAVRCRMTVLPASLSSNQFLSIGIATDYGSIFSSMVKSSLGMIGSCLLIVLSLIILLVFLHRVVHYRSAADKKLTETEQQLETVNLLLSRQKELARNQRLELVGTMTAAIAHEFNNLLTPIMGYSMMGMEQLPDDEGELFEAFSQIYHSAGRAKELISRLNALTRKNTARSYTTVDANELARKVVETASVSRPGGVTSRFVPAEEQPTLFCNESQIAQVLLNLLLNAFDASREKGGEVTVSVAHEEDTIVYRVSDHGCGIPDDVLEHILEPFFTTKEAGRGTGLGLAITNQVVLMHGGTISVDTSQGEGTTFTIRLPKDDPSTKEKP